MFFRKKRKKLHGEIACVPMHFVQRVGRQAICAAEHSDLELSESADQIRIAEYPDQGGLFGIMRTARQSGSSVTTAGNENSRAKTAKILHTGLDYELKKGHSPLPPTL